MVTSLGLIMIVGLLANAVFTKLKLPGLLGMLITGILIGPYVLNLMDSQLMMASADFRKIALIIILLRAGFGISREELNKVGKTALLMSFLPGLIEGLCIAWASTWILGFTFFEGGILGFIIAAVSPAVVVPQMISYAEEGRGIQKGIPTLILASASVDDVFAITLFTTFLGLYSGAQTNIGIELLNIPISIVIGVTIGLAFGFILVKIFEKYHIRDTKKVLYILGSAIMITAIETFFKSKVEIAGLLGVMAIGFIILELRPVVAKRLSIKFGKIWIFTELLLFVLVGSQVNIEVALHAGGQGLALIFIGLFGRSIGVLIATLGTNFTFKERLFCVIAYIPKATVQAAIGGIPLALGVGSGELMLAIAVLSIVVTAPLGAIGIHIAGRKWLKVDLVD